MTYSAFIRKGHGYDNHSSGQPCTAFDGFRIIAAPLGDWSDADRESRVYRRNENGTGGVTYGSHVIKLAVEDRDNPHGLYLLMHNGSGREVLKISTGPDWRAMRDAFLALDERTLYAVLYSLWDTASSARYEAQEGTASKWAQAFADKRLKVRRRQGVGRVEMLPKAP